MIFKTTLLEHIKQPGQRLLSESEKKQVQEAVLEAWRTMQGEITFNVHMYPTGGGWWRCEMEETTRVEPLRYVFGWQEPSAAVAPPTWWQKILQRKIA